MCTSGRCPSTHTPWLVTVSSCASTVGGSPAPGTAKGSPWARPVRQGPRGPSAGALRRRLCRGPARPAASSTGGRAARQAPEQGHRAAGVGLAESCASSHALVGELAPSASTRKPSPSPAGTSIGSRVHCVPSQCRTAASPPAASRTGTSSAPAWPPPSSSAAISGARAPNSSLAFHQRAALRRVPGRRRRGRARARPGQCALPRSTVPRARRAGRGHLAGERAACELEAGQRPFLGVEQRRAERPAARAACSARAARRSHLALRGHPYAPRLLRAGRARFERGGADHRDVARRERGVGLRRRFPFPTPGRRRGDRAEAGQARAGAATAERQHEQARQREHPREDRRRPPQRRAHTCSRAHQEPPADGVPGDGAPESAERGVPPSGPKAGVGGSTMSPVDTVVGPAPSPCATTVGSGASAWVCSRELGRPPARVQPQPQPVAAGRERAHRRGRDDPPVALGEQAHARPTARWKLSSSVVPCTSRLCRWESSGDRDLAAGLRTGCPARSRWAAAAVLPRGPELSAGGASGGDLRQALVGRAVGDQAGEGRVGVGREGPFAFGREVEEPALRGRQPAVVDGGAGELRRPRPCGRAPPRRRAASALRGASPSAETCASERRRRRAELGRVVRARRAPATRSPVPGSAAIALTTVFLAGNSCGRRRVRWHRRRASLAPISWLHVPRRARPSPGRALRRGRLGPRPPTERAVGGREVQEVERVRELFVPVERQVPLRVRTSAMTPFGVDAVQRAATSSCSSPTRSPGETRTLSYSRPSNARMSSTGVAFAEVGSRLPARCRSSAAGRRRSAVRAAGRRRTSSRAGAMHAGRVHRLVGVGFEGRVRVGGDDLAAGEVAERVVFQRRAVAPRIGVRLPRAPVGDGPEFVRPGPRDAPVGGAADGRELVPAWPS